MIGTDLLGKYRQETSSGYYRGNGHAHHQRSQWDHWDGWNANPNMDTSSRSYNDWNRSSGILKQHSQELHNFGSNGSITKETSLDNYNRAHNSRYRNSVFSSYRPMHPNYCVEQAGCNICC